VTDQSDATVAATPVQPGSRLTRGARQAWVLAQLRTAYDVSPRAYAAALDVSVATTLLDLRDPRARGLVRVAGTTKDRRYFLA